MIDRIRMTEKDSNVETARIGAVRYLNSKPLIEGLAHTLPDARLILDLPSRLAEALARGDLDVALIPSIEAFSDPAYEVISDACVATRGPVLSVKLYCRVPPGDVRTLALDEGSRTSAALVQIMLHERFGVSPRIEQLPMGMGLEDTQADAVLLIGDRAIQSPDEEFAATWDLGEEWLEWTGLPFVFAMWVGRSGAVSPAVEAALALARDRGVCEIPNIAAREAPLLGITEGTAIEYLTHNLHFRMESAERNGLMLFHRLASRLGFAPKEVGPKFRGLSGTRLRGQTFAGTGKR